MGKRKRKLSVKRLPVQRRLQFSTEGEYFDLKTLFDKLNAEYFRNALRGYTITWGRRRKHPPKEYFVFGTIQEEDKMIRIHPLLDAPFVPTWFLEYVVYHEMLHAVVPEEIDEYGRRRVHTREFYRRERQFHCYYRARRWEDENLDRFLRLGPVAEIACLCYSATGHQGLPSKRSPERPGPCEAGPSAFSNRYPHADTRARRYVFAPGPSAAFCSNHHLA
jgi:hypothetical protein